jgi:hypothetical protein
MNEHKGMKTEIKRGCMKKVKREENQCHILGNFAVIAGTEFLI